MDTLSQRRRFKLAMTKANPFKSASALEALGLLPTGAAKSLATVTDRYAVAITPEMAALIDPTNANDPIGRQFLPTIEEGITTPEEHADPIGDAAFSPVKGIVHRYPDRVLLKLLHICPVYCRFCFRREVVGPKGAGTLSAKATARAFDYISANPDIWEVILTGGDPFMLSSRRIAEVTGALSVIEHVKVVRWHTRVPIVDPGRITPTFARALRTPGKATFIGIHANHPNEFTPSARDAIARLADAGLQLVSQTVLLKGINDNAETLERLMRLFVENRIQPYYLHHTDLAPGTSHFRTSIAEGQTLMRALRGRLSGLAQPRYVIDIPGGHGKVPIGPSYLDETGGEISITDYLGQSHQYPDASS